ncbi:DEKNAAC101106 [Brettanomyces naardenensis]|uniref:DEKNAAC101106 n=1 Tax=Brettanomyces naardenensis TaxID=13370 RepID=A0A448YHA6_BRENA|nr:DEKNAAC101106 [Brettanomyces naardenensis]
MSSIAAASGFFKFNEKLNNETVEQLFDPSHMSSWKQATEDSPGETLLEVPMQTYKTIFSSIPVLEKMPVKSETNLNAAAKPREPRINSEFLKFYALDYSCKLCDYLKISVDELDMYQQEFIDSGCRTIDEFLDEYIVSEREGVDPQDVRNFRDGLKLSLLSRDKLWRNVILPPRNDLSQPIKRHYIQEAEGNGNNSSCLVRTRGKFMPWLNIDDFDSNGKKSIPPYGILANGAQFTVKGWCNERWLSCAN